MKTFDKNITFIRWGNLNPRKHKEARLSSDDENRGFHTAPCYKGIYAFPQGLVERFLLGGVDPVSGKIQNRCFFLKDDRGNKVDDHYFWNWDADLHDLQISKQYKKLISKNHIHKKNISCSYSENDHCNYVTYLTNVHKFKYNGDIWHHLEVSHKDKLAEVGDWVKTTFVVYIQALNRTICKEKFSLYMEQSDRHGSPHSFRHGYSKDHFEVFIEKLK